MPPASLNFLVPQLFGGIFYSEYINLYLLFGQIIFLDDFIGDGRITFDKFIKAIAPKIREKSIGEEIREAFRVFDKDGNGTIR